MLVDRPVVISEMVDFAKKSKRVCIFLGWILRNHMIQLV